MTALAASRIRFGRAVVLLQLDDPGVRVIPLKIEDVADVRPAKTVDALVGVANDAHVAVAPAQQVDQHVLRVVGILVLVDQHVPEALPVLVEHIGVLSKEAHRQAEQVVEVHRVVGFEFLLVVLVKAPDVSLPKVARPLLVRDPIDQLVLGGADALRTARGSKFFGSTLSSFKVSLIGGELVRRIKDDEMSLVARGDRRAGARFGRRWRERCRPTSASANGPTICLRRSLISVAALLVKVTARICDGSAFPYSSRCAITVRQNPRLAATRSGDH